MERFAGCWSCGSHGPCYEDCYCAACRNPVEYMEWCVCHPDQYRRWRDTQKLAPGVECTCPKCRAKRGWPYVVHRTPPRRRERRECRWQLRLPLQQ